jgi:hypothetical protein
MGKRFAVYYSVVIWNKDWGEVIIKYNVESWYLDEFLRKVELCRDNLIAICRNQLEHEQTMRDFGLV